MAGESRQQKFEAAGCITPTVRRASNEWMLLLPSSRSPPCTGLLPREWSHPQVRWVFLLQLTSRPSPTGMPSGTSLGDSRFCQVDSSHLASQEPWPKVASLRISMSSLSIMTTCLPSALHVYLRTSLCYPPNLPVHCLVLSSWWPSLLATHSPIPHL